MTGAHLKVFLGGPVNFPLLGVHREPIHAIPGILGISGAAGVQAQRERTMSGLQIRMQTDRWQSEAARQEWGLQTARIAAAACGGSGSSGQLEASLVLALGLH